MPRKSYFFPLNIFGGLHGGKPDDNDIKNAVEFVKNLDKEKK